MLLRGLSSLFLLVLLLPAANLAAQNDGDSTSQTEDFDDFDWPIDSSAGDGRIYFGPGRERIDGTYIRGNSRFGIEVEFPVLRSADAPFADAGQQDNRLAPGFGVGFRYKGPIASVDALRYFISTGYRRERSTAEREGVFVDLGDNKVEGERRVEIELDRLRVGTGIEFELMAVDRPIPTPPGWAVCFLEQSPWLGFLFSADLVGSWQTGWSSLSETFRPNDPSVLETIDEELRDNAESLRLFEGPIPDLPPFALAFQAGFTVEFGIDYRSVSIGLFYERDLYTDIDDQWAGEEIGIRVAFMEGW